MTETWYGPLAMGQQDRTGLMYMRNRYYNPESGQFTQQDPIGIAGGLNLYGYANGDPINFSDPFGLDPCDEEQGEAADSFEQNDANDVRDGTNEEAKREDCRDLDGDGKVERSEEHAFKANAAESAMAEAWHSFWGVVSTAVELPRVQEGLFLIAAYRGGGRLSANPRASGPHSSFRRGPDGRITNYQTFEPNALNPSGFQPGVQFRATGGPHRNKVTGQDVYPPLMHDRAVRGGVRPAAPGELPRGW